MKLLGYTTDLNKRLESLQIGNPHLLCTYRTIENVSRKMETRLHRLFNEKKIRGEWFAITPDMIDSVCGSGTVIVGGSVAFER